MTYSTLLRNTVITFGFLQAKSAYSLLVILTLSVFGWTQDIVAPAEEDSTQQKYPKLNLFNTYPASNFLADTFLSTKIDTSFEKFFYYNPQYYNFKMNLGVNGSPQRSLINDNPIPITANASMDHLEDFRFNADSIKFFELTQPYARVFYINGAKREEGIDIEFSQNVRKNWNWGVEYQKTGVEGFYPRQKTSINNFRFFQSFVSKNNRYRALASIIYNDTYFEENGGLQNDTLFEFSDQKVNRAALPLQLSNAKNTSRNQEYFLDHSLNYGRKTYTYFIDENDSIYPDSIIGEWIQPSISFHHQLRYKTFEYSYEDQSVDQNYYANELPFGNYNIYDQTYTNDLINEFGVRFHLLPDSAGHANWTVGGALGVQYLEYSQYGTYPAERLILNENYYNNLYIKGSLSSNPFKNHAFTASSHIFLGGFDAEPIEASRISRQFIGYNAGDFKLNGRSTHKIRNQRVELEASFHNYSPGILFTSFESTARSWNNDNLNKLTNIDLGAKYSIPGVKFDMGANYQSIINHLYFNESSLVRQYDSDINISSVFAQKLFKLSKFYLRLKLQYQFVDQAGIINLPEFLTFNSLYYQTHLFKGDMLFRIGSDLFFTSSYYGDAYDPTIRQFITQNSKEIGLSPIVDFYFMVNVDRAFFFAKLANALEGIPSYNYYAAPAFPMPDRSFKFGIKWEFIN